MVDDGVQEKLIHVFVARLTPGNATAHGCHCQFGLVLRLVGCFRILFGAHLVLACTAISADEQAFVIHRLESRFQAGETLIRVLLPEPRTPDRIYPVVYVLPVEAGMESRYGDGLVEIRKHDLHHQHQAIFVSPTFSHLPWYADHPTDSTIQQESYVLNDVLPFVERSYPVVTESAGRLLLGFSKSGWGSWSLLLRHPDVFRRAAAWDAPLMMDQLGI